MKQQLENFGIWIPRVISERKDITPAAKLVFGFINGFSSNGKKCYAPNKIIGEWAGIAEDTVSDAISRLVDVGLVDRTINKEAGNERNLIAYPLSDKTPLPIGENTPTLSDKTPPNNIYNNKIDNINTPIPPEGASVWLAKFWGDYPKESRRETKDKVLKCLKTNIKSEEEFKKLMRAIEWKKRRLAGYKHLGEFEPNFPYPCKFIKTYDLVPEPLSYIPSPRTPVGGFKSTEAILAREKELEAEKRRQSDLFDQAMGLKPRSKQIEEQKREKDWQNITQF